MTYRLKQTLISIILWLNPWLAQHALQSWHSCIRPVRSIRDRMCRKRGSGRTGRHALLTDASPGCVKSRDRWGDALTGAVPNDTTSTRVRSSILAIWFIGHPAMHAQSCRKVQHQIPMGWQVGFHRKAGIAAVSYPVLHRPCRQGSSQMIDATGEG